MKHYIGIDNSSLDHKVQVIDGQSNKKMSFTISNNLQGFKKFSIKINQLKNIQIGFEIPHSPLVDYLHSQNHKIYSLNPLKIKRYKQSLKVYGNKNDEIDALAIAEYLRNNKNYTRELLYNSSEIERLKTLSIIHTRLTNDKARHINKLHFVVRQYFPLQEALFSDFACTIQLKMIIKYPTLGQLKAALENEIRCFLKENKYRRSVYIDRIIEKIKKYDQLISPDIEYAYKIEAKCLRNFTGIER